MTVRSITRFFLPIPGRPPQMILWYLDAEGAGGRWHFGTTLHPEDPEPTVMDTDLGYVGLGLIDYDGSIFIHSDQERYSRRLGIPWDIWWVEHLARAKELMMITEVYHG